MINYRGEKFSGYSKPKRTPGAKKKSAVLVKKGGKTKIVRFGDPKMSIKAGSKTRRASYCARSGGIKGTNDIFSPNYWSRKAWSC